MRTTSQTSGRVTRQVSSLPGFRTTVVENVLRRESLSRSFQNYIDDEARV
ncbi:MAG: hypothetical protein WA700_07460 [Acidobacteriaceae bacterium]